MAPDPRDGGEAEEHAESGAAGESEEEEELRERFEAVVALQASEPQRAVAEFRAILADKHATLSGAAPAHVSRFKEWSILHLCALYGKLGEQDALVRLLKEVQPMFQTLPKAKTAKIVRTVIDSLGKIAGTEEQQVKLCNEYIEWAIKEKRAFLRQRIQVRLANLYLQIGRFSAALVLLQSLASEVKKLDDKQLLVEIFLIESRVHHALHNVPRSKSSLTAARSVSNSIYVGPQLQGEIDLQAGMLNADDKDFRTAFSYFFEAFEALHTLGDARSVLCLKYMLLSKIMFGLGDEVPAILNGKNAVGYSGPQVGSMRAIAKAYKERSLQDFENVLQEFRRELLDDELVSRHLKDLQAKLLEQNLLRLIEPFSRVEIDHVARLIKLPRPVVETRLSKMILDKKLLGILDQGTGELVVFDAPVPDSTYDASLGVLKDMSNVVDSLFRRADKLEVA
jgi:26S proteasome regulatory subunit N6